MFFEQCQIELNKIVHVMDPLCHPKLVWQTYFLILFSTKSCKNHRNKTYDMKHRPQITTKFQELNVLHLHCQHPFHYLVLRETNLMARGVVVITTAQLHSTKPELRFCTGLFLARGVSEIRDGEDLWQWFRLEIRLNTFRQSTISQKQFINSSSATYVLLSTAFFNAILMRWSNRPWMYRWLLQIIHCHSVRLDLYGKFYLVLFRTLVG